MKKWISTKETAIYLGISEKTLQRWRKIGFLKYGIHYRRKFPTSNSHLLYQIELTEQTMIDACAKDPRTLETVRE
tara:strand:- start:86 stop:310 length:225 start_codon:yes stop_codon:yes gene_type:complete